MHELSPEEVVYSYGDRAEAMHFVYHGELSAHRIREHDAEGDATFDEARACNGTDEANPAPSAQSTCTLATMPGISKLRPGQVVSDLEKRRDFMLNHCKEAAVYRAGDAFGACGLLAKDSTSRRTETVCCRSLGGALLLRLSQADFIECFARGIFRKREPAKVNWSPVSSLVILKKDPTMRTEWDVDALVIFLLTYDFWRQVDVETLRDVARFVTFCTMTGNHVLREIHRPADQPPMYFILSGRVRPAWADSSSALARAPAPPSSRNSSMRVASPKKHKPIVSETDGAHETEATSESIESTESQSKSSFTNVFAKRYENIVERDEGNDRAEVSSVSAMLKVSTMSKRWKGATSESFSWGKPKIKNEIGLEIRDAPVFRDGDALLPEMGLALPPRALGHIKPAPIDRRFIASTKGHLLVLSAEHFEDLLRPYIMRKKGFIYPFASCQDALRQRPHLRTNTDLLIIHHLLSSVGGIITSLAEENRWLLSQKVELLEQRRGTIVVEQGTFGDQFYIILAGSIAVHVRQKTGIFSPQPEHVTVERVKEHGPCVTVLPAGTSFGEKALLFGEMRSSSCITTEFSQLITVSRDAFHLIANDDLVLEPWLSYEILRMHPTKREATSMRYLRNFCRSFRVFSPMHVTEGMLKYVLMPGLSYRAYKKEGEQVFLEGDDYNGFVCVVLSGCVFLHSHRFKRTNVASAANPRRSRTPGRTRSLENLSHLEYHYGARYATLLAGDMFGEYWLSEKGLKRSCSAITVAGDDQTSANDIVTEVLVISKNAYTEWLEAGQTKHAEESEHSNPQRTRATELIAIEKCRMVLLRKSKEFREELDIELIREVIEKQPFVAQLPKTKIEALAHTVTMREVVSDEIVYREGDPGDCLYIVLRGSVNVYSHDEASEGPEMGKVSPGRPGAGDIFIPTTMPQAHIKDIGAIHIEYGKLTSLRRDGDAFGEAALRAGRPRYATVLAREPTELLIIRKSDFDDIIALMRDKADSAGAFRPAELMRTLKTIEDTIDELVQFTEPTQEQEIELSHARKLKSNTLESILRPIPIFADMGDSDFEKAVSRMRCVSFKLGDTVFALEETPWIGVLVIGTIQVFGVAKEHLHTILPGEQFGHLPVIWERPTQFLHARATEDSLVMSMSRVMYTRWWKGVYDRALVERANFLRSLDCLEPLALRHLAQIDMICTPRQLPRGALVCAEDMKKRLYAVLSGECHLLLAPKSGETQEHGNASHEHEGDYTRRSLVRVSRGVTAIGGGDTNTSLAFVGAKTVFGDFGIVEGGRTLAIQCMTEVTVLEFDAALVSAQRGAGVFDALKEALLVIVRHHVRGDPESGLSGTDATAAGVAGADDVRPPESVAKSIEPVEGYASQGGGGVKVVGADTTMSGVMSYNQVRQVMRRMEPKAPKSKPLVHDKLLRAAISRLLLSKNGAPEASLPPADPRNERLALARSPSYLSGGSSMSPLVSSRRTSRQPSAAHTRPGTMKSHRSGQSISAFAGKLSSSRARNPFETSISVSTRETLRQSKAKARDHNRASMTSLAPIASSPVGVVSVPTSLKMRASDGGGGPKPAPPQRRRASAPVVIPH